MKYIKLYEDFQLGDLNFMSPEEIQDLFLEECKKQTPDINLIRVIVDNGLVDVNAKGYNGNSPLHWATDRNSMELAKLLISAGADVNIKNDYGTSPLFVAVSGGNVALVKYLISAGADVNAKDNYGNSSLHWAVGRGNIEMQDLLKKHGAVE